MSSIFNKIFNVQNAKKQSNSLGDPGLKQGARFNLMQKDITSLTLPNLPLMDQTTGPGLQSAIETLDNMNSSNKINNLDDLDTHELKKLSAMEENYRQLIMQLQSAQQKVDNLKFGAKKAPETAEAPVEKGDPANNYEYSCSSGSSFYTFNANTLTATQKASIAKRFPQQAPTYYACIQGCPGTCKKNNKNSFGSNTLTSLSKPATKPSATDSAAELKKLRQRIKVLNGQIQVQIDLISKQIFKTQTTSNTAQDARNIRQTNLRGRLNHLLTKKQKLDALLRENNSLDGQLENQKDDLQSTYLHYLAWIISGTTILILAMKQINK